LRDELLGNMEEIALKKRQRLDGGCKDYGNFISNGKPFLDGGADG